MPAARKLRCQTKDGASFVVRGKLARVAELLATAPGGVTGWDCIPWCLRLDRRIDRLRDRYGLSIETIMEGRGDSLHARYVLADRITVEWL